MGYLARTKERQKKPVRPRRSPSASRCAHSGGPKLPVGAVEKNVGSRHPNKTSISVFEAAGVFLTSHGGRGPDARPPWPSEISQRPGAKELTGGHAVFSAAM